MKQVLIKKGRVVVEEVPAPVARAGCVLVRVGYSCISSGTELANIAGAGQPLVVKAARNREQVGGLLSIAASQGVAVAVDLVKAKLNSAAMTGYSCAGVVVDPTDTGFRIGDRVACAGAGYANHAEFVCVPRNLVMPIPDTVGTNAASTVALGGIALQAVRRAETSIGETAAVIGLGVIGQITVQLLRAAGVRVAALDLNDERLRAASDLGAELTVNSTGEHSEHAVMTLTGGRGVDAAIVSAASRSSEPLHQAARLCRQKGRIVLVGDVPISVDRELLYAKELDLLISTSYGPGRYDPEYEELGRDYPFGYVRWTENRNMSAYLDLLAAGSVRVEPLIGSVHDIEDAPAAYESLKSGAGERPIMLLKYAQPEAPEQPCRRTVIIERPARVRQGALRVAVIGAGGYARLGHLPNLSRLSDLFRIWAIADIDATRAAAVARQYCARYVTTDYAEVLADPEVDVALIATRHNLHAALAEEAVRAGKAVYLEKPMALNREQLTSLAQAVEETQARFIVGFNRRFSPFLVRLREMLARRQSPLVADYLVAAGRIPPEHWVHGPEGGGRIIGEGCHMFDVFNFLVGRPFVEVEARGVGLEAGTRDNAAIRIAYEDGSVCSLIYTPLGGKGFPKETIHVLWDGGAAVVDDFRGITFFGETAYRRRGRKEQKGRREIWQAFGKYLKGEAEPPISLEDMVSATEISFRAAESLFRI